MQKFYIFHWIVKILWLAGKKFWNLFHLQPMRDQKVVAVHFSFDAGTVTISIFKWLSCTYSFDLFLVILQGELQYFIGVQLDGSDHVEPLHNRLSEKTELDSAKLVCNHSLLLIIYRAKMQVQLQFFNFSGLLFDVLTSFLSGKSHSRKCRWCCSGTSWCQFGKVFFLSLGIINSNVLTIDVKDIITQFFPLQLRYLYLNFTLIMLSQVAWTPITLHLKWRKRIDRTKHMLLKILEYETSSEFICFI